MIKIFKSKKAKISTIMFIIIFLFIIVNFIGYINLVSNIKSNHLKNEQILFYQIQRESNKLLTSLLHNYTIEKENIINKHNYVLEYLSSRNYDISLDEIYELINKDEKNKPYNIYITDENLKIVNTTFKPDLGFDLSFAKQTFLKHKKENIIGLSGPIFETYSTKFFSFTDSYLPNSNRVLQISYKYSNTDKLLKSIQNIIDSNKLIQNSKAYITFNDGYIGDFIFKSFKARKFSLEEIKQRIKKGKDLVDKIKDSSIIVEDFSVNNKNYKNFYFSQKSAIFDKAQIVYSVTFDQTILERKINKINFITACLSIFLLLIIYFLFKLRDKESLLLQKDNFIKHSVHEIKTPLSIISLNNQLREKILGQDTYTEKIHGAIKTLKNSYEDMSFLISKDYLEYEIKQINLHKIIKDRVEYFKSIAYTQGRFFNLIIDTNCLINISDIEITRLIDNNLSNAIKYSEINSTINIFVKNNTFKIESKGKEIIDKNLIFDKYKRENNAVGGHGLGLSIVKDICEKYDIKVMVTYENNKNCFKYKFNCHSSDI